MKEQVCICIGVLLWLGNVGLVNSSIPIRIGALVEGKQVSIARRALNIAVKNVNEDIGNHAAQLECYTRKVISGDSLDALTQTCDLAKMGLMSLMSVSSGPVDMTLRSISASKKLPLLEVGSYFVTSSSKYVYSAQPRKNLILRPVLQYAFENKISNSIIVYDDQSDTSMVQDLSYQLFEQSKNIGFPSNFLVRIEANTKGKTSMSEITHAAFHIRSLIKRNNLITLEAVFVFAKPSRTLSLISKVGKEFRKGDGKIHFIIVNNEMTTKYMRLYESATTFGITTVKQYVNKDNPRLESFVQSWNEEYLRECNRNCSRERLGPNDIPLQAYHIADGLWHFSSALKRLLDELTFTIPTRLVCQDPSQWHGADLILNVMKKFNTTGILGKVSIGPYGYNEVASYEVCIKSEGENKTFVSKKIWKSEENFEMNDPDEATNISNTTLRVVTVEEVKNVREIENLTSDGKTSCDAYNIDQEAPFVMRKGGDQDPFYEGFSIDVLKEIAKKFEFQYNIYTVPDGKYGAQLPNGSWNGLIGELVNMKADLAVAAMTITPSREVVVDFAKRYMDYSVGIVIRRSEMTTNFFSFVQPFRTSVWLCISSSCILVTVFIFFLNQVDPNRYKGEDEPKEGSESKFGFSTVIWFVYGSFMQQGSEMQRTSFPVRIVIGFWWLFTLIVVSSYTANLAAFLTVQRMDTPIRSFSDLSQQQDIKYGTVSDTSIYDFIMRKGKEANDLESQYKRMAKMVSENRLSEAKEGFERAASENFAFLWDVAVIEYEVIRHESCGITTVSDSIYDKGYGFALQHGSPYRDKLSHGILALQENGVMDQLRKKWWPKSGKCTLAGSSSYAKGTALNLENFIGIFFVLVSGIIIACVIAGIEITLYICKGNTYPPIRDKTNFQEKTKPAEKNIRLILSKKKLVHQLLDEICVDEEESIVRHKHSHTFNEKMESPTKPEKMQLNFLKKACSLSCNSTLKKRQLYPSIGERVSEEKSAHDGLCKQNPTFAAKQVPDQAFVDELRSSTKSFSVQQTTTEMNSRRESIKSPQRRQESQRPVSVFSTMPRVNHSFSPDHRELRNSRRSDDDLNKSNTFLKSNKTKVRETMTLNRADLFVNKGIKSWGVEEKIASSTSPLDNFSRNSSSGVLKSKITSSLFKKSFV